MNTSKENLLNTMSIILIIVGISVGILCLCTCNIDELEHIGSRGNSFDAVTFTLGVWSMILSVLSYAFIQVIIQISLTLKEKNKI